MGYTHYWNKKKKIDPETWSDFTDDVTALINKAKVRLCWEFNEPDKAPEVTAEVVRFNGKGDNGYETFLLRRVEQREEYRKPDDKGMYFNFCKTAQKPYDKYVVAVLHLAEKHFGDKILFSSDGDDSELREGIELATK